MLQEICADSLRAVLENSWVQTNFILFDVHPPESIHKDIPGDSFILRCTEWEAMHHFTLMMVSKDLSIMDCFRVPFVTTMGRDVLVVDVPVHDQDEKNGAAKSIRLCTTHLESRLRGRAWRRGQLTLISNLFKGIPVTKSRPIAGLVGGDMNTLHLEDHEVHRARGVDLKDVWEDVPAPPMEPWWKDLSYGRAMGYTFGYQSHGKIYIGQGKRLDKFLYTGSIETMTPTNSQDVAGRLGRIGVGLRTKVKAWECNGLGTSLVRGKTVMKPRNEQYSDGLVKLLQERGYVFKPPLVRNEISTWVSDHFGIAVRVKVL